MVLFTHTAADPHPSTRAVARNPEKGASEWNDVTPPTTTPTPSHPTNPTRVGIPAISSSR